MVSRRGVLSRRLDAVPMERVQSLRLTQGPVDRLFGLARVHVDSPPGPVHVLGEARDLAEARRFVLEAMERSRTARHGERPIGQPKGDATPPTVETTQLKSPNPPGSVSSAPRTAWDSPAT